MPEQTPTVVLVHGAFADSSSWNGVIERLAMGMKVTAPANPLRESPRTPLIPPACWRKPRGPFSRSAIPTAVR